MDDNIGKMVSGRMEPPKVVIDEKTECHEGPYKPGNDPQIKRVVCGMDGIDQDKIVRNEKTLYCSGIDQDAKHQK